VATPEWEILKHRLNVSRETEAAFHSYVAELARWQRVKNLVSEATLKDVWTRHIADSAQLVQYAPDESRIWVDLGSGAGLPGLILGIMLRERPGATVHLVEANSRKCAFLRAAARLTGAAVEIHNGRIDDVLPELPPVDVITARALAPLPVLLAWTEKLWRKGVVALFPKGQDLELELTDAAKSWRLGYERLPSLTDHAARIVRIHELQRL
jgi:16S rRNA (guanine527-N7)-methyltransferase